MQHKILKLTENKKNLLEANKELDQFCTFLKLVGLLTNQRGGLIKLHISKTYYISLLHKTEKKDV